MKFLSIQHSVPDLVLTNDQAVALFEESNRTRIDATLLAEMTQKIYRALEMTGIKERRITPPGQPVGHLVVDAARRAMAESGTSPDEIDLVIYVGIGRGWLEPAMSSWLQHELGLHHATGFDLLDACASWMRGLDVANTFLKQGTYRKILLVNSEAGMSEFAKLSVEDSLSFDKTFAIFTVGEAATATLLAPGSDNDPDADPVIQFKTFPEAFDLCLIPLANARCYAADAVSGLDADRFYAISSKLVSTCVRHIVETYRGDGRLNHGNYDRVFSHSASAKAIEIISRQIGLPMELYFGTHEHYANTSSASIPLGMSLAREQGRLERGDRVLTMVGSAGVTVGLASFVF